MWMKAQKSTYKELTKGMPFQSNTHDEQGLMVSEVAPPPARVLEKALPECGEDP